MNTINRKIQSSRAKLLIETGMAFNSVYMCFHEEEKNWFCNPLKNDVHLVTLYIADPTSWGTQFVFFIKHIRLMILK